MNLKLYLVLLKKKASTEPTTQALHTRFFTKSLHSYLKSILLSRSYFSLSSFWALSDLTVKVFAFIPQGHHV